jgi:predicted ATPase/class 3 adenylate cyclase
MSSSPVPVGTVTFLFSDIEGSTRLEESLGTQAYASIRERHRTLLRQAFGGHGGEEQGTEGDSFFVTFPSAREALAAAVEGTQALAAEPWPGELSIRVRMGLHTGEASVAGGSLIGLDVNRAARIAAAAHGGQILASETTRSLVGTSLPAGVTLRDLGEHRLKDLTAPTRLFQAVAEGLTADFPPPRTLDARPNNLPVQLTSFVGREAELAEAERLFANTRLLTLTGPGGTGKTRLSLELAASLADEWPDGVFFVPLEPVREPSLVAPRILASLGLTEVAGRPARDVLIEWLTGRKVLLVIDNFEQVLGAGPFVADLLRANADLRIIVTSRAALRISGEQEYALPGLPVPPIAVDMPALARSQLPGAGNLTAQAVSNYESVKLFLARAMAVRPDFRLTDENAQAIGTICARLHGMPLAIELAAARVRLLRPEAILERLTDQLSLLSAGSRDLPPRQQTLRGAIAWSYDILDDGSRRLLDRLSVFTAGCDLEGAEAICGPADELGLDILDGLTGLVDQSLLRLDEMETETRFRLLETIREFASEMLDSRGEAETILDRREDWYVRLAEEAAPLLAGGGQRTWLERLELEHDNIRAVLTRAVALERPGPAIRLAFAMWRFWQKRGHLNEARRRLEEMAAADWTRAEPVPRARLMEALGGVLWWQADIPAMKAAYGEALDIWRSLGDKAELANALYNYSFAFSVAANPSSDPGSADPDAEGIRSIQEALALYREIGDRRGEANTLWGIGNIDYFANVPDGGARHFQQALDIFRDVGDVTMEAWSLHMLGSALLRVGKNDESRPLLRDALRRFADASDTAGLALTFDDLASQAVADGELERAARIRGASRRLAAETGAKLATFVEEQFETYFRPNVRATLDPEALQARMAEGEAWPLEDAIEYALGGDLPAPAALASKDAPTTGVGGGIQS